MMHGRKNIKLSQCKVQLKVKVVCLHTTMAYRGSRVTAPLICNLGTRWKHTAWRILISIILSASVLLWVSVNEHQEEKTVIIYNHIWDV